MTKTNSISHICAKCGHRENKEASIREDRLVLDHDIPRICGKCDGVSSFPLVLGNYQLAILGLVNRIKSLEEKVNGADDKDAP